MQRCTKAHIYRSVDLCISRLYSVIAKAFSTNMHSWTIQHPCIGGRRSCCRVQRNLRSRPDSGFKSIRTVFMAPLVCDPAITGPTLTTFHSFAFTMDAKIGFEAKLMKFSRLPPNAALHRSDEKSKQTSRPALARGSSFLANESMQIWTMSSADNSGEGCGKHIPSPGYPISNNSESSPYRGCCTDWPNSGMLKFGRLHRCGAPLYR